MRTAGEPPFYGRQPSALLYQAAEGFSLFLEQPGVCAGFHIEPDHRFGVGSAQVEAPALKVQANAVRLVHHRAVILEVLKDCANHFLRVVNAEVDLYATGKGPDAFVNKLRQRASGLADAFLQQQPREHDGMTMDESE